MDGIIRKVKFSYPFKVGELQKIDVFFIDDDSKKFDGNKMHSIIEEIDDITGDYVYKIFIHKEGTVKFWKKERPFGCTVEVEYAL